MKSYFTLALACLVLSTNAISQSRYSKKDIKKMKLEDGMYANMSTTKGDILLYLEMDKTPLTVASFVGLAEGDFTNDTLVFSKPFFDGLTFHRVIADFMIQGGDPAGNGTGSPGYKFVDEFDSTLTHSGPGILSMANSGAGTSSNGSQFFITHKATPHLNNRHSVFGHVVKGQKVVDTIEQNDTIISVTIYKFGKPAKKFDATAVFKAKQSEYIRVKKEKVKKRFDAFTNEMLKVYPKAQKGENGLLYIVEKEGNGEKPKIGQNVTVHYTGFFLNGDVFDSSHKRNQPFVFPLGQKRVIAGWDQGVALMSVGSKYKLILPHWLAYGHRGSGPIPPNSTLVFDVELLSFK